MKRLLLVDDDKVILRMLKDIFRETYEVAAFDTTAKAELYIKRHHVDLILLDIILNHDDMDGISFCKKLKKENTKKNMIPIIFLTALSDENTLIQAYKAGGIDYMVKPIREGELKARVAAHIDLHETKEHLFQENIVLNDEIYRLSEILKDNKGSMESKALRAHTEEIMYTFQEKLQAQQEILKEAKKLLQ